tara:strand:- start:19 stop:357 length:339 start_codon:yes stop_codon:yes gene_type:complete
MERYVKNKATGKIVVSGDDDSFSVTSCEDFITSRGLNLADYDIGLGTGVEVDAMRESALTATQLWERDIKSSDKFMPRYAEDILDGMPNKLSVAKITLDRLQAKKDLRATKP